jgi:hypothetical protein
MSQLSELQGNPTLALRAEAAIEPIRELAAMMADESDEARHLSERLAASGSLKEYDVILCLSILAQAVSDRGRD